MIGRLRAILSDIRFEQTLFSLPFALLAMVLAAPPGAPALPPARTWGFILLALVSARSAAMAINRFADAALDARNPRTASRAVPAGQVSRAAMGIFALVCVAVFLAAAAALNPLCLKLAPVALLFLCGYSWTKRFTPFCHVILGMTLGIAPLGAWVAVRGAVLDSAEPWLLGLAVTAWVAGFDMVYACPDRDVDVRDGLRSVPQTFGVRNAFRIAAALHVTTIGLLAALGTADARLGTWWNAATVLGAGILATEHLLVRPGLYTRMATAFFRLNALFSAAFLAAGLLDVLS